MSYPWTRVPREKPPLDRTQLRLLPIADLFMALLRSRPGGLSLRTTWVTPATLALATSVCVIGLPAGAAALVLGIVARLALPALAGLLFVAIGLGAGSVAVYGMRQRLIR